MDSGAPTLPGPRPPLLDSDSSPSKGAPSPSLNASANSAPVVVDTVAIGLTRGTVSGGGDIEINGAIPLVTTATGALATEVATAATDAGITTAEAGAASPTGTTTVDAWDGGDAQGTGAVVMGFTMVAVGTALLTLPPAPPATLPPVRAFGNENTPTDAMNFRAFKTRSGKGVRRRIDVED